MPEGKQPSLRVDQDYTLNSSPTACRKRPQEIRKSGLPFQPVPRRNWYARLLSLDPAGAAATSPSNRRYVERNLEIVLAGGKPLSFWRRNWQKKPLGPGWTITRNVPELDHRIALRAARMLREGAVEEVAALGPCSSTAERTLGLQLIRSMLHEKITREECQAALALATRQYAKRQRTWLKREQWLRELPADENSSTRQLAERIMQELKS